MLMLFQRHNRLYQKEHDIPIKLLSMHKHGNYENEPTQYLFVVYVRPKMLLSSRRLK